LKKGTYFHRHFREGMNNFKRNGWITITSISSLSFMLFLVGVTFLLLINLNHITTRVEQNVEIHVYLENTDTEHLKTLSETIHTFNHVASIEFISKNEGLKSFMNTLGDEGAAFQTLKNENPLNDELVVKAERPQDISAVAKQIKKLQFVEKVEYAKKVVGPLLKTTKLARLIGETFIIILTLIAVHLVTNTIKMTVLAQKEEIQLRKLIGATDFFIRIPFFIEGSLIGAIGAFLGAILNVLGYYLVYSYFNKQIDISLIDLIAPYPLIPICCLILVIFGVLIGIWGANSSLRRLLRV